MAKTQKVKKESDNGKLTVRSAEIADIEVLPEQTTTLSEEERQDLERLEAQIISAAKEIAKALWEINVRRLYRERYETFEKYCEERFQLSPRYIYYQVKFGQVLNALEQSEQSVQILPQSEYQVRPLSKIKDESEQVQVWLEAVERAEGRLPSFPVVEEVVREKLTPKTPPKTKEVQLSEGEFCLIGGQIAQVIALAEDEYLIKRWDNNEATVTTNELHELRIDKRSLSRVQAYFERLGTAATLVERYREKTATTVLSILAKVELPPTELETKLLKCLERELTRRDTAPAEKD